jgi:hypothetical protein
MVQAPIGRKTRRQAGVGGAGASSLDQMRPESKRRLRAPSASVAACLRLLAVNPNSVRRAPWDRRLGRVRRRRPSAVRLRSRRRSPHVPRRRTRPSSSQHGRIDRQQGKRIRPCVGILTLLCCLGELGRVISRKTEGLQEQCPLIRKVVVTTFVLKPAVAAIARTHDRWWGDPTYKGRPEATLGPLDKAPFFALEVKSGTIGTKGGPRVNPNANVLDVDGSPIPGLYTPREMRWTRRWNDVRRTGRNFRARDGFRFPRRPPRRR